MTKPNTMIALPFMPELLRLSSSLKSLRESGHGDIADRTAAWFAHVGCHCSDHGQISDPIVVFFGTQFVFVCPDCCSDAVLDAYLAEGSRGSAIEESPTPPQDASCE